MKLVDFARLSQKARRSSSSTTLLLPTRLHPGFASAAQLQRQSDTLAQMFANRPVSSTHHTGPRATRNPTSSAPESPPPASRPPSDEADKLAGTASSSGQAGRTDHVDLEMAATDHSMRPPSAPSHMAAHRAHRVDVATKAGDDLDAIVASPSVRPSSSPASRSLRVPAVAAPAPTPASRSLRAPAAASPAPVVLQTANGLSSFQLGRAHYFLQTGVDPCTLEQTAPIPPQLRRALAARNRSKAERQAQAEEAKRVEGEKVWQQHPCACA